MGRIILPEDTGRFPDTFGHDFYLPDLKNEHVKIVAQLPGWADARWYLDLVRRAGHEVKSRWVVQNSPALGADLRAAAERSIREALIVVSDSTTERREIQASLENRIVKKPLNSLDSDMRRLLVSHIDERAELGVLFDSPAFVAMNFAKGDANMRKLRRKLGGTHNVRIFGTRATAALVEYLDPERCRKIIEQLYDRRYVTREQLTAHCLADAIAPHWIFDGIGRKWWWLNGLANHGWCSATEAGFSRSEEAP